MKNHLLLFVLVVLLHAHTTAQQTVYLEANNVRAAFADTFGVFFQDVSGGLHGYEVPKNSGINAIFASNFWISGLDAIGNLKGAFGLYQFNDFNLGPIAQSYNTPYTQRYRKIFKVTRSQVNYHKTHFWSAGYVPVAAIAEWPGNGNTANAEAHILAPFFDRDNDGFYEPLDGDYPDFCGDEAVFFILHSGPREASGCSLYDFEIHVLGTAFKSTPDSVIDNTVFLRATIFNRGHSILYNTRFSHFVDADLGCSENDRVGCDTTLHASFFYNSMLNGNACDSGASCLPGANGYGCKQVSIGATFLNKKMTGFSFLTRTGPGYTPLHEDPTTCVQFRNYQIGGRKDGSLQVGFDTITPTLFLFPGNPYDSTQWSELFPKAWPSTHPGDRRSITNLNLDTLFPNQAKTLDLAIVTSFTTDPADPWAVTKLKRDIRTLRQLYQQANPCIVQSVYNSVEEVTPSPLVVSPIPTTNTLHVEVPATLLGEELLLTDIAGKKIWSAHINATNIEISLAPFASGVYWLQTKNSATKVVKQ